MQMRSSFPNLTRTPFLHSQEGWDTVVLQGARVERGMANYSETLTAEDSVAIREYIITRAIDVRDNPPPVFGFGPPPSDDEDEESDDVHEEAVEN